MPAAIIDLFQPILADAFEYAANAASNRPQLQPLKTEGQSSKRAIHNAKSGSKSFALKLKHLAGIEKLPKGSPLKEKSFVNISAKLLKSMTDDNKSVPPAQAQLFRRQSIAIDRKLLELANCKEPTEQQLKEANQLRDAWRQSFSSLLEHANRSDKGATQTITTPEGMAYSLQAAPELTRLTLKGGGAKGHAYMGALTMMDACGKLKSIRQVSGASVGAITASMVACGVDFHQAGNEALHEKTENLIFAKPAKDSAIADYVKEFGLRLNKTSLGHDAYGMIDHIDKTLRQSMESKIDDLLTNGNLSPKSKQALAEIGYEFTQTKKGPTFGQLRKLAQACPGEFKDLYLVAFDVEKQERVYINTEDPTYKDLPISLAVRASAALPGAIKSLTLNINGVERKLIDGGVSSNGPTEAFHVGKEDEYVAALNNAKRSPEKITAKHGLEHAQTMVMAFKAGANKLYAPLKKIENKKQRFFNRLVSRNKKLTQDRVDDSIKSRALGSNVLSLGHGKLGTTSFSASAYDRLVAQMEGEVDTAQYLLDRTQQAILLPQMQSL